jgi:CheY-like chemotaxis protein
MTEPRRTGTSKGNDSAESDASPGTTPARETILVVEDDPGVRRVAVLGLRAHGYTVLEAASGREALRLRGMHEGRVHLLVTDVVMPEMDGRQVADELKEHDPEMRVLYLSGYADESVLKHGVRENEVAFLQKPFTLTALSRKVRDVLDARVSKRPPSGPHRRAG